MSFHGRLLSGTVLPLIMTMGVGATLAGCATQAPGRDGYQAAANPCNAGVAANPCKPGAAAGPCNPCAVANPCNPRPVKVPDSPCEVEYEG